MLLGTKVEKCFQSSLSKINKINISYNNLTFLIIILIIIIILFVAKWALETYFLIFFLGSFYLLIVFGQNYYINYIIYNTKCEGHCTLFFGNAVFV